MSCLVVFLGLVMFIGLVMFMILNQPIVLLGRMREGTSLGYLPAIADRFSNGHRAIIFTRAITDRFSTGRINFHPLAPSANQRHWPYQPISIYGVTGPTSQSARQLIISVVTCHIPRCKL